RQDVTLEHVDELETLHDADRLQDLEYSEREIELEVAVSDIFMDLSCTNWVQQAVASRGAHAVGEVEAIAQVDALGWSLAASPLGAQRDQSRAEQFREYAGGKRRHSDTGSAAQRFRGGRGGELDVAQEALPRRHREGDPLRIPAHQVGAREG